MFILRGTRILKCARAHAHINVSSGTVQLARCALSCGVGLDPRYHHIPTRVGSAGRDDKEGSPR